MVAIVGGYLASAGVKLIVDGDTTMFSDWLHDQVDEYNYQLEANQETYRTWFNENGEFLGSEQDMEMILTPQARGYYSMGKELNGWLEGFKNWLVGNNNISNGVDSLLYNVGGLLLDNGSILPYFQPGVKNSYMIPVLLTGESCFYTLSNGSSFGISVLSSGNTYVLSIDKDGSISNNTYGNMRSGMAIGLHYNYNNNGMNLVSFVNSYNSSSISTTLNILTDIVNGETVESSSISVEGTLTDGYDDFQDALDQGLSNESENDNAKVLVGVGDYTDVAVPDIADEIVSRVIGGTIATDIPQVLEDQDAVDEETDNERPFVQEVPEGWVIVDGLEDFFPFCIPWDLYGIISLLNAEPVAPVIHYNMGFGGRFDSEEIVLDFSAWEYAAMVFRILIIIGFVIFLIIKTRDLIRG